MATSSQLPVVSCEQLRLYGRSPNRRCFEPLRKLQECGYKRLTPVPSVRGKRPYKATHNYFFSTIFLVEWYLPLVILY